MNKIKNVDEYIALQRKWHQSLLLLRELAREAQLQEKIKWGSPVYEYSGKNILGLGGFKNYVAIWFFQGALLEDEDKKLINAQEGKTKALRQWRFISVEEIEENRSIITQYILQAIENQKNGLVIKPRPTKKLVIPAELKLILEKENQLNICYEKFSVAKKREFAEYINDAKKVETKNKRIEKIKPMIMQGLGLNEQYKNK